MELAGKAAIVTGAAAGIGRAIALRLAADEAAVLIVDVDEQSARSAAEVVTAAGGSARAFRADVTRDADVKAAIAFAEQTLDGLDVLVNNAGGYRRPVFPDAPLERWTYYLDLNLRSVMVGIVSALEPLRRRGGGAIVNVASTAGLGFGPHPGPEYAAAKAAVMRLTACLASLREEGIRVNCVCPYTVRTEAVAQEIAAVRARGDELPATYRGTLLEPEDVADAAVRLIEDESLAGRVLVLVGGREPELLPVDA
jgi:NAD(P)-dependent dehydrogenase (short-subunit alcohol dehydrogenase family)